MAEISEIIKNLECLECEENDLYNKIKRLIMFMSSLEYEKIDIKQKYLLEVQLECMNAYDKCLMTRIKMLIDDMKEREYYGMD